MFGRVARHRLPNRSNPHWSDSHPASAHATRDASAEPTELIGPSVRLKKRHSATHELSPTRTPAAKPEKSTHLLVAGGIAARARLGGGPCPFGAVFDAPQRARSRPSRIGRADAALSNRDAARHLRRDDRGCADGGCVALVHCGCGRGGRCGVCGAACGWRSDVQRGGCGLPHRLERQDLPHHTGVVPGVRRGCGCGCGCNARRRNLTR